MIHMLFLKMHSLFSFQAWPVIFLEPCLLKNIKIWQLLKQIIRFHVLGYKEQPTITLY